MLIASALSVHTFLKACSRAARRKDSKGAPDIEVSMPKMISCSWAILRAKTDWTTFVRSKQSMQLVRITPFYIDWICTLWFVSYARCSRPGTPDKWQIKLSCALRSF